MLSLRPVTPNDVELLFTWANDLEVRMNSFNLNLIKYEDHITWFQKKIKSSESHIFILEKFNMPVGQIRFDLEQNPLCYRIDYSIGKKYQRNGYGKKIIEFGLRKMSEIKKDCPIIRASVKNNNTASIICFQENNFKKIKEYEDILEFEFILRGNDE